MCRCREFRPEVGLVTKKLFLVVTKVVTILLETDRPSAQLHDIGSSVSDSYLAMLSSGNQRC